jgi:hypothetical protein
MNIYQDESGDLGFKNSSSQYFVVALLCPQNNKHLSNVTRKFKGDVIQAGWPKSLEVKAHNLYTAKSNPDIPITYKYKNTPEIPIFTYLNRLNNCDIEIEVIVVKKSKINAGLKTLPYGILFNYFSKQVLIERMMRCDEVNLYVDETNKQNHQEQHFDGYIKTSALLERKQYFPINIEHGNSNVIHGISAVDFVSWSTFRKYEKNDSRFFDILKTKINNCKTFYFSD